jgi:hypothetical protein
MHHQLSAQLSEWSGSIPGQKQRDHQEISGSSQLELLEDFILKRCHRLVGAKQRGHGQEVFGVGTVLCLPVLEHPIEGIELAGSRAGSQPQLFTASAKARARSRKANF